jgi:4-amino-4-deoxy-L-arabinose transferase-like glycosyltransferase
MNRMTRKDWLLLGSLILLGLGLRLYRLPTVPLGGHGDVAWNGIEALDWLHGVKWPLYVYHIYAPEPVIVYLTGLSILVFGPTFFAARLVTVIASTLVIPVGFFAVRPLGGDDSPLTHRTAWLFALAYAVSFHPIMLSKTGQRAQIFPLLVMALLALFAYAWRGGKWWAFGAAAVVMALASYTYIPARLMPLLIALWVIYEYLATRPAQSTSMLAKVAAMLALTALLIAPQIVMYLNTPEAFFARSSQSAGQFIFQTGLKGPELWLTLGRKCSASLPSGCCPGAAHTRDGAPAPGGAAGNRRDCQVIAPSGGKKIVPCGGSCWASR